MEGAGSQHSQHPQRQDQLYTNQKFFISISPHPQPVKTRDQRGESLRLLCSDILIYLLQFSPQKSTETPRKSCWNGRNKGLHSFTGNFWPQAWHFADGCRWMSLGICLDTATLCTSPKGTLCLLWLSLLLRLLKHRFPNPGSQFNGWEILSAPGYKRALNGAAATCQLWVLPA